MRLKDLGEIELIRRLSSNFRLGKSVIVGPGDDTAVIQWTKDKYMLYTCDMTIEGVHFDLRASTPFQIGWKALGRNISDIAAMGGLPKYAVVSLAIDPAADISIADGICAGLKKIADRFGVSIVGGDMAESKKIVIDVSLVGEVKKKEVVLRSGAKKGDIILVTGSLGGSIKGRHLNFIPRIKESQFLVKNFKINSMIDISDGLVLDLSRILKASVAGARLYEDKIPVSKEAKNIESAFYDGEDYELLFTMNPKDAPKTPFKIIGEIVDKKLGYKIVTKFGREEGLKVKGYAHF
ncbi:MAG: thiamine-monophosphate kinase [Candidatus Omnitrophica bacterium]|nr:thiamine-monophosphate kinase [Candidatus Omnitrophota bacterium]